MMGLSRHWCYPTSPRYYVNELAKATTTATSQYMPNPLHINCRRIGNKVFDNFIIKQLEISFFKDNKNSLSKFDYINQEIT